jgi:RNA polymerase sigma factor (sigma-70 family)
LAPVRAVPESPAKAAKQYNEKTLGPHHIKCGRKDDLTAARKLQGNELTEAEAIERAKQGDAEAFEVLYHLHKRRVYSLCLRMTANTADAEDLTQEAFLQLFRKIGTFRGESAFSTWLHRMAVNVVLMRLRKKGLPVVPLEETIETEEETPKRAWRGGRGAGRLGGPNGVAASRGIAAARLPNDFCAARRGRLRAQRNRRTGRMFDRKQQVTIA